MANIVEKLEANPIYNLSLSSKELFHSNFWKWLFERNKEYIKIFFPMLEISDGEIVVVEREEEHRDLTIYVEYGSTIRSMYVIENKFKSLPNKEQLIEYEEKIPEEKNFVSGVITGIEKPAFIKDLTKWEFKDYKEIR